VDRVRPLVYILPCLPTFPLLTALVKVFRMCSYDPLDQLRRLDKSSSTFHDQVNNVLDGEEYKQWMSNLRGSDLVEFVDYLDKVRRHASLLRSPLKPLQTLDALDPASRTFRTFLHELSHICGARTTLPRSCIFSLSLLIIPGQPAASRGSGDVYRGTLKGKGLVICIKRIRVYRTYDTEDPTKV